METFDPTRHIEGSERILEADGSWPNFHDAEVYVLNFWRGDMRPDDNIWVGVVIEATLELAALEKPFIVGLKFHDCNAIEMSNFNHENMIYELEFSFEERGFYTDGVTPLPPYIYVKFVQSFGVSLSFKCFRVEVVERREVQKNA